MQLVLGVNTEDAVKNKLDRIAVELSRWASEQGIKLDTAFATKTGKEIEVRVTDASKVDDFNAAFLKEFPLLRRSAREDQVVRYSFKDTELERIKSSALEQAVRVVRSRVDKWGVSEPMINRRADGSILVQLPGFSNPQKAKELLGKTAQLSFKMVDNEFAGFEELRSSLPEGITVSSDAIAGQKTVFVSEDREKLQKFLEGKVPSDRLLLFHRKQIGDGSANKFRWTSYVVKASSELTGEDIMDASFQAGSSLDGGPQVSLKLTAAGGKRFADLTGANIGKNLGIVLDNVIESAPVINTRIPGGNAVIQLGSDKPFNQIVEEGQQLALILKSGAIPATITVLEQRQVGASLGPELANQGIKGILLGLVCVLIFMLIYYRRPGIVACLALCLNGLFLLAVMAGFGFALTLPGIAGFVLTLGMAVDANVLINERIRQELREGRHPRLSIQTGFKKVFGRLSMPT